LFVEGKLGKSVIEQPFPEFVHEIGKPPPVDDFFHPVQQVHGDRRANFMIVQELRSIDPVVAALVEIKHVVLTVENPSERFSATPAFQTLDHGVLPFFLIHALGHVLAEGSQAAQGTRHPHDNAHGLGYAEFIDGRYMLSVPGCQPGHELLQEHISSVAWLHLEGIETGILAVFKRQILAAHGADQYFRSPILIKKDRGESRAGTHLVFLQLCVEKSHQHGFPRTRHAEDAGVAQQHLVEHVFVFL
jgi:hypothetical protein